MKNTKPPSKPRRGRPPHTDDKIKRYPLNMRTTKAFRERVEQAASEAGRSIAQEIEHRLEQSFQRPDHVREERGLEGPDNEMFVNLVGVMFQAVSAGTGADSVWSRPLALLEAEKAMGVFFKELKSHATSSENRPKTIGLGKEAGEGAAKIFLTFLKNRSERSEWDNLFVKKPGEAKITKLILPNTKQARKT